MREGHMDVSDFIFASADVFCQNICFGDFLLITYKFYLKPLWILDLMTWDFIQNFCNCDLKQGPIPFCCYIPNVLRNRSWFIINFVLCGRVVVLSNDLSLVRKVGSLHNFEKHILKHIHFNLLHHSFIKVNISIKS